MNNHMYKEREQLFIDCKDEDDLFECFRFDFLDSVEFLLPGERFKNINMSLFLHGHCLIFAYRLKEKFGYEINLDFNDEECTELVHAYCFSLIDDKPRYIDIRGITDDYEEMRDEFLDWDIYGNISSSDPWFKDESVEILNRNGEYKEIHKIIDDIFLMYEQEYDINASNLEKCLLLK